MPVIIPSGFSQVALHFSPLGPKGSKPTTTFGVTGAPAGDLGDLVYAWWHEYFRPIQRSDVSLVDITQTGATTTYVTNVGEQGTRGSASAPPQVAALVQLRTGLRGHANRGRMYWPTILAEGDVTEGGTIDPSFRGTLLTAAAELVAALHTAGNDMVILHSASSDPTAVESLDVSSQTATQRRRNWA
jgi:hypothetical protein